MSLTPEPRYYWDDPPALGGFEWPGPRAPWVVTGSIWRVDGVLVIVDLSISAGSDTVPAGGVSSSLLREIPLGQLLEGFRLLVVRAADVHERVRAERKSSGQSMPPKQVAFLDNARRVAAQVKTAERRSGRPRLPDEHYRAVALAFLEEQDQLGVRGVRSRLAERYDRPPETIRDWIREARQRGFLSLTTQGRGGAEAGGRLDPLYQSDSATEEDR